MAKGVRQQRVKAVFVAVNMDEAVVVLDEKITSIIDACHEHEVPVVYAMTRRNLGKAISKPSRVCCVGVYSFEGALLQARERAE